LLARYRRTRHKARAELRDMAAHFDAEAPEHRRWRTSAVSERQR
jgi:hypothetical protein